ncbi:MAG: class I SAM-dependent methyltransferase [Candidatus Heimdallarchaeota archaeon]|nr:class I SAM-dependent methyltransferase [Candidatus Heimdallarchaeota archaeon]
MIPDWDDLVEPFEQYRSQLQVTSFFEKFCEQLKPHARILDVGCGIGIPFSKFMVDQGFDVLGIDVSSKMIHRAKQLVDGTFVVKNILDTTYQQEFHAAVASYSLQLLHPDQFNQALIIINNALMPQGLFYLSLNEPGQDSDEEKNIFGKQMYFKDYSLDSLLRIVNNHGFELISYHRSTEESYAFDVELMLELVVRKI